MSEIQSQGASGITMQAKPAEARADHGAEAKLAAAVIAQGGATEVELPADAEIILTQDETASTSVLILEKPPAGVTETVVWTPGTPLVTRFAADSAASVTTETINGVKYTVFTWSDGAVLRVAGLDTEAEGSGQVPVTLEDGTVVALDDFAQIAGVQPAAGPAAAAPGVAGPGDQGHAAGPTDPGDIGQGPGDTGPLGYTELFFSVPELTEDTDLIEEEEPPPPVLTVSINSVTVTEGDPIEGNGGGEGELSLLQDGHIDDPATTITFTVTLSGPSEGEVTVNYTVVPGSALEGIPLPNPDAPEGDYNGGFTSTTTQVGDHLFKLADNVSIAGNEVNGTPTSGYQTGTFTFAESGTFLLAWGASDEGDSAVESPSLLDNVRLNGALLDGFEGGAFTFGGFSIPGGSDVTFVGVSNGISPTEGTGQLHLDGESLTAAAAEALLGLPAGSLTALANDNNADNGVENATDGSVLLLVLTVNAGDVLTFNYDQIAVDGNGPGNTYNDFSYFYSEAQGSFDTSFTFPATGGDIDPLSGTITFAPGETSKTITLNVVDDFAFEQTEQFTVVLSDPVGALIGSNPGVGTILDNDGVLAIVKDAALDDGGAAADEAGDIIIYTYAVTNVGAPGSVIANVVLTDDNATPGDLGDDFNPTFIGGDTDGDGLLDAGETWTYEASHVVTQADIDGGEGITNIATASAENHDSVSDDASIPVTQNPSLNIAKEVEAVEGGQIADEAGEIITYSITVTNTGNTSLNNVVVSDPFADAGITRNADLTGDDDTVLEVGEVWSFTASHTVTQEEIDSNGGGDGFLENVATVTTNEAPPDSDDASVPVLFDPALEIDKEADPEQTADEAGELITYSITVTNTGNVSLTNIVVTDPFADNNPVRGLDITGNDDDVLDVGEVWSYTASHTVTQEEINSNGGGDGFLENVATADSDQSDPDSDDASVPVGAFASLAIQKVLAGTGQVADVAGEPITYNITVTNTGNTQLTNVVVSDPFADAGITRNNDVTGNNDNVLDIGEVWSFTATHTVTQQEIDSNGGGDGFLENVATATSNESDPASDDASVPVDRNPALNILKTATPGQVADQAGEPITYSITVQNTGNTTLTGVVVTDPFADTLVRITDVTGDNDNLLEVGETWAFSATHIVTQQELDTNGGGDGTLENTATADSNESPPDSDTETVPVDPSPTGGIAQATVFEAGNERVPPAGDPLIFAIGTQEAANGDPGEIENASGSLNLTFGGDGPGSVANRFDWSTTVTADDPETGAPNDVTLTSGGFPVTWVASNNGETLSATIQGGPNSGQVVAILTATPDGGNGMNFSYQQIGPFDHPDASQGGADDPIALGFSYTIQDSSGTQSPGSLTVTVNDDEPAGIQGGNLVDTGIVKAESVQSGLTGTNMAFVIDVSDSTTQLVDGGPDTRLDVEIAALKTVLQQAVDANVLGPVLIVAFHGNWVNGGNDLNPLNDTFESRTVFETYGSAADALAAIDAFFAALSGPPWPNGPTDGVDEGTIVGLPGSTRWEGGLDVAADWYAGTLTEDLPFDNHLSANPIIQPNDVNLTDNRLFFLTDGGNNNAFGNFLTTNAGPVEAASQEVLNLYTNFNNLATDVPNLTIRTVAVLNGDQNGNLTQDAVEYASIVDQSDDNLINNSATIIDDEAGASGIVAGFGELEADDTAEGNLFEDDDLIGGPGSDGVTPIIGADGFQAMVSFTYQSGPLVTDTTTITASDTVTTFLGGTIEVNFATGDYFYTAPTGDVSGTDHFSYVILDGDDDPQSGVLDILVGVGSTTADNAGFHTDSLVFWSAAGSVWVSSDSSVPNIDEPGPSDPPPDTFFAVLHTGNALDAGTIGVLDPGDNRTLTPTNDRTVYTETDLVGFINEDLLAAEQIASIDGPLQAAPNSMPALNANTTDGAILKGSFDVVNAGASYDVSFDWQFFTNQGTDPVSSENDIAFVVIEGQLFLLANSDNEGNTVADVITGGGSPALNIDGQDFENYTAFQNDTTFQVADAGNDGIINVAFGVMNAGATANAASALVVDDVNVTPA